MQQLSKQTFKDKFQLNLAESGFESAWRSMNKTVVHLFQSTCWWNSPFRFEQHRREGGPKPPYEKALAFDRLGQESHHSYSSSSSSFPWFLCYSIFRNEKYFISQKIFSFCIFISHLNKDKYNNVIWNILIKVFLSKTN